MAHDVKQRINLPELDKACFGAAVLTLETYGASGRVVSSARIAYVKDHCETFSLYGDFSVRLAQQPLRATQKNIDTQHAATFPAERVEALKEQARAFYANKAK